MSTDKTQVLNASKTEAVMHLKPKEEEEAFTVVTIENKRKNINKKNQLHVEKPTLCIPLKHKIEQHYFEGQNSGTQYVLHARG